MSRLVSRKYAITFVLITSLFFLWGFARSILDVLNKHFQEILSISLTESALVQVMTYMGYFLMAIPAGFMITRGGYRRGIVTGLLLFGTGALLFIPGEWLMSFPLFLIALFLIGCGLVMLETSANPFATELGDPSSAAGRLNLAQAFNGLGCIMGPMTIGAFLFSTEGAHISLPYSLMAVIVLSGAVVFMRIPLPDINEGKIKDTLTGRHQSHTLWGTIGRLLTARRFITGWIALFFYEISEISINSLFINYTTSDGWLTRTEAPEILSLCGLGLFMLARVAGSLIMTRVKSDIVLRICGIGAVVCSIIVALEAGSISHYALFGIYLFEAIMFPTIFAMTIIEAGKDIKIASSLLMMTPIGGAVGTLLMSHVAQTMTLSLSFLVPAAGFVIVLIHSLFHKK